jgi:predicted transcriptional regulator
MTTQIAVRLPDDLVAQIDALVPLSHPTRSSLVRTAIESYVSRVLNERDAAVYQRQPLSDAELALADDARSWDAPPQW